MHWALVLLFSALPIKEDEFKDYQYCYTTEMTTYVTWDNQIYYSIYFFDEQERLIDHIPYCSEKIEVMIVPGRIHYFITIGNRIKIATRWLHFRPEDKTESPYERTMGMIKTPYRFNLWGRKGEPRNLWEQIGPYVNWWEIYTTMLTPKEQGDHVAINQVIAYIKTQICGPLVPDGDPTVYLYEYELNAVLPEVPDEEEKQRVRVTNKGATKSKSNNK